MQMFGAGGLVSGRRLRVKAGFIGSDCVSLRGPLAPIGTAVPVSDPMRFCIVQFVAR